MGDIVSDMERMTPEAGTDSYQSSAGGQSETQSRDERFMRIALEQANLAALEGETPVGAVCVMGERVISVGRNHRETGRNALAHAELEAIDGACRALGGWRLWQCELYVTLEPCPMCAGAIINSRIRRVVFGASDSKAGSCGSVVNLFELSYNHRPELVSGCLADECSSVLTGFFRKLRETKKDQPRWKAPSANNKSENE